MKSVYTILIIDDRKIEKNELSEIMKKEATVFMAALPEKYFDNITSQVDFIQQKSCEEGIL